MIYTRKLSLLLFILWVVLVVGVVGVTLERTQRSLVELQGTMIWQRLRQLPRQLLAQRSSNEAVTQLENIGNPTIDKKYSSGNLVVPRQAMVTGYTNPPATERKRAFGQLAPRVIKLSQKDNSMTAAQGCYRLSISSEGEEGYRQFNLTAPARWVIDIPGHWRVFGEKTQKFSAGPVKNILLLEEQQHLRAIFWTHQALPPPTLTQESGSLVIQFTNQPIAQVIN